MAKKENRKDLEKYDKSVTKFLKDNYEKVMGLTINTKKLKAFLEKGFKNLNVSDYYKNKMFSIIDKNSPQENMFYLTNALLSGKGLKINKL